MPNEANPAVSIEIGGKERHLVFNFGAMIAFEEATGKNLFEEGVINKIINPLTPSNLRALIWAMLRHEDKSITLDDVTGWINMENMKDCGIKMIQALIAAMPRETEGKKNRPLSRKRPTG
jgi:hypothetical protein